MKTVRILVVDDHELIRASLKALLENSSDIEVVGEARDGREAYDLVVKLVPDVVLMDISMTGLNGLEATRLIKKDYVNVRVIMLSMHTSEQYVLQALRAGASGYLLKQSAPHDLEVAIAAVAQGEIFLSPAISKHVIDAFLRHADDEKNSFEYLTPRQREILQLIAEGKSSKQIAQMFDASVKTIESHRASLMERLDIHEIAGLVRYAIRNGVISAEN